MHKCINGFTKEKIKETIFKNNKNVKSSDGKDCKYRSGDGNMCFVGCFIPDGEYLPEMENKLVDTLLTIYPKLKLYMPLDVMGLLVLQKVHDSFHRREFVSLHEKMIEWVDVNVEDA